MTTPPPPPPPPPPKSSSYMMHTLTTRTHANTHNSAKTNLCVRISREIKMQVSMSYIFKITLTPFDRVNLPIIVPFSNLAL